MRKDFQLIQSSGEHFTYGINLKTKIKLRSLHLVGVGSAYACCKRQAVEGASFWLPTCKSTWYGSNFLGI